MYRQSVEQKKHGGHSTKLATDLVNFLCSSEANNITGRLLSAKWDTPDVLKKIEKEGSMFRLRRIDGDLFYGK
jgi:hypothetical protein